MPGGTGAIWTGAVLPLGVLVAALAGVWWLAVALAAIGMATPWMTPGVLCPTGLDHPRTAPDGSEAALAHAQQADGDAVCILMRLADPATGAAPDDRVVVARGARIARILRAGDHLARRGAADFVIVLAPGTSTDLPDLEALVQLAARVQGAATAPGPGAGPDADAERDGLRLAATVGLCRATDVATGAASRRSPAPGSPAPATPAAILDATAMALADALADGIGTIRVFAPCIRDRQSRRAVLASDAARALAEGGFTAWFQPQICTDTGRISGFEALARWEHPEHGIVPPAEFMPVLEAAGHLEQLGTAMLDDTLRALVAWDRAGFDVPSVGVNMSQADLRDPHLAQRIAWMLDRHDLHGNRLSIEILESVMAEGGIGPGDSPVLRNVTALAEMGCRIDLDDFGTGHASITSLHRLPVTRVKIDRSFVTGVDRDRARQKMMMTILSMCEHLGLETLAEGVETPAEHAMLAQLGCNHVQGFGIGRPMPFDATCGWLRARNAELDAALRPIRRRP